MKLRRRKNGVWFLDHVHHGQRVRECLGTCSEREASKILAKKHMEKQEGKYNLPSENSLTYDEAVERFFVWAQGEDFRPATIQQYRAYYDEMAHDFSGVPMNEIDKILIDKMRARLRAPRLVKTSVKGKVRMNEGISPWTVNHYVMALSGLFTQTCRRMYNPVKDVTKPTTPPTKERFLTQTAVEDLLTKCDPRLRPYLFIYFGTGARKSEILGLRWRDVVTDCTIPYLHFGMTKNGDPHTVPMNQRVREVFETLRKDGRPTGPNDLIFQHPKGKSMKSWLDHLWRRDFKKLGLTGVRLHDTRHTYASLTLQAGVPIDVVGKALNHKDGKSTARYAKYANKNVLACMTVMDSVLPPFHPTAPDAPSAPAVPATPPAPPALRLVEGGPRHRLGTENISGELTAPVPVVSSGKNA